MGEYIQHRDMLKEEEIKIAVCRGKGYSNRDLIFPLEMLREFKALGYEDFYAENFRDNGFLDDCIEHYDEIPKSWMTERTFSQISASQLYSQLAEDVIRDVFISEFDCFMLPQGADNVYVFSDFYREQVEDWLQENQVSANVSSYQFQSK